MRRRFILLCLREMSCKYMLGTFGSCHQLALACLYFFLGLDDLCIGKSGILKLPIIIV